jgi:hypothetical protein
MTCRAVSVLAILVGSASHAFAAVDEYLNIVTVPEPSSLAVLTAGAGILAAFKLWKRK